MTGLIFFTFAAFPLAVNYSAFFNTGKHRVFNPPEQTLKSDGQKIGRFTVLCDDR